MLLRKRRRCSNPNPWAKMLKGGSVNRLGKDISMIIDSWNIYKSNSTQFHLLTSKMKAHSNMFGMVGENGIAGENDGTFVVDGYDRWFRT